MFMRAGARAHMHDRPLFESLLAELDG